MREIGEEKSMVAKPWHYFIGEGPAGKCIGSPAMQFVSDQ